MCSPAVCPQCSNYTWTGCGEHVEQRALLARAIVEEPPLAVKEGGLIREGFDAALDELKHAQRDGKDWIAKLQQDEINRTGIASLKVRFNSVFGYYIEVTRANLDKVPPHYIRKQTIANGERFITPELKEMEGKILGAEERAMKLEYELFLRVREEVIGEPDEGILDRYRHDPRITPVGRVLRRWSLDELPQLWNVIRGEMSLVGPRPPLPSEVDGYDLWHRRRLSMKPGMTGLWQVRDRRDPDFDRWVASDLEYIDRWSLWLDLKILVRTIPAAIEGR